MKRPSDQLLAQRMLATRDRGFSFAYFLHSNAKRYLLLFAVIILAIGVFAAMNLWAVCHVFVGLLLGALLRDLGWIRIIGRNWPFSKKVTDWEKVERLAAGQDV